MKKALTVFSVLSLVIAFAIAGNSIAQGPKGKGMGNGNGNHKKCCPSFVDENKDGKCDKFVDADGDGKCDNCSGDGKCKTNCCGKGKNFTDANGDGKCDNFVDANGDGINDKCTGMGMGMGKCAGKGKNYKDANSDGKCDNFVDSNNDGKCDNAANCCQMQGSGKGQGCSKGNNNCAKNKKCMSNNNTGANSIDVGNPYPNPFSANTAINYELKESGNVSISVFDANGNLVKTIFEGRLNAGSHSAAFDGSGMQAGSYSIVVKHNGNVVTKQAVHVN